MASAKQQPDVDVAPGSVLDYLKRHRAKMKRDTLSLWLLIQDKNWTVTSHQILATLKKLDEEYA